MKFQRDIASSQATLPIVCTIALALWFALPSPHNPQDYLTSDYGLWQYLPPFFHATQYTLPLGVSCAAIAVYMMVELKNQNLLLRVNSYMLSSTLALLLAVAAPLHPLQPSSLLTLLTLYAYFPLFASYQMPHPHLAFSIYLPLSLASLLFPQFLFLIPTYWCLQIYLRSLTLRTLLASLIATLLPYWFYGGIAIATDTLPQFLTHLRAAIAPPDFTFLHTPIADTLHTSLPFLLLTLILLAIGIVDFQSNKLLDKTRTRTLYNVVQWHSLAILLFILIHQQHTATLLPLLMIDASILYGHFFTLTHTRLSHIINIIASLLLLFIVLMQVFYI